MSGYAKAVEKLNEQRASAPRTDYRCAAHGCPNAGCLDDHSEQRRGRCYFHATEGEFTKWPAITQRIRETWPAMANWGTEKAEYEARKAQERTA